MNIGVIKALISLVRPLDLIKSSLKDGHQDNAGWGSPFREGNDLVYIAKNELSGFRVQDHFLNPENSIERI